MPIIATVGGNNQITANVSESAIKVETGRPEAVAVNVGGFVSAVGVSSISAAQDVQFQNTQDGDLMRYSTGKWRNYPEENLTDGGNF